MQRSKKIILKRIWRISVTLSIACCEFTMIQYQSPLLTVCLCGMLMCQCTPPPQIQLYGEDELGNYRIGTSRMVVSYLKEIQLKIRASSGVVHIQTATHCNTSCRNSVETAKLFLYRLKVNMFS